MKKLLTALFLVTFMAMLLPNALATSDNYEEALEIVEQANDEIDALIAKAQAEALVSDDDAAIIAELLAEAEQITAEGIEELAELGYEGYCVYIEVEIDGQTVLVDPLEVWNW